MQSDDLGDRNALIAALGKTERAALARYCERVGLERGKLLYESGAPIEYCYFPEDGVGSVVTLHDGAPITEIGIFGRDGFSGSAVLLGASSSPHRAFMQVDGVSGLRIASRDLCALCAAHADLRNLLLRYVQVFLVQVASSATSNGRGRLDQRLARWLLMCHDRVDGDEVLLTHEFMATMITAQRTGVTEALHIIEGDGLIRSLRGRVHILDRPGLEALAGDSYGLPEAEHERLIGPWRRPRHHHRTGPAGGGPVQDGIAPA